jgi:hypothetical protein
VHRDVIGLVTLNLVLRRIGAGMTRMTLVLRIARVNPDDPSADTARFRVPANVITDFECLPMPLTLDRCNESIVLFGQVSAKRMRA